MEEDHPSMEMLLETIPDRVVQGRERRQDYKPVYAYRPDKTGKRYTLYFNDSPTTMVIQGMELVGAGAMQAMAKLVEDEEPVSAKGSCKPYTGIGLPPGPNMETLFPGIGHALPSAAEGPPAMNQRPVVWYAERGDGGETIRFYLTLKTAIKKELEYAECIFKAGEIATLIKH
jgi:hypothetical protein